MKGLIYLEYQTIFTVTIHTHTIQNHNSICRVFFDLIN